MQIHINVNITVEFLPAQRYNGHITLGKDAPMQHSVQKHHTTPRLELLCRCAASAQTAADIGCDHAYLSILLISSGTCLRVIASDIATGPVDKARGNILRFGMNTQIELRRGDGLSTLAPAEADTIIIAGMGGRVIADILGAHPNIAKTAKLILQPMTYASHLRRYLYENGYTVEAEDLVKEDRRIYSVITATAGGAAPFCEVDTYISPAVLENRSPLLAEFVLRRLSEMQKIAAGMKRGDVPEAETAYHQRLTDDMQKIYDNIKI